MQQTSDTKDMVRMSKIKEFIELEVRNNKMARRIGGDSKTKEQIIQILYSEKKLITQEEYEALVNGATEITIAGETIDFAVIESSEIISPEIGGNTGESGGNESGNTGTGNGGSSEENNVSPITEIPSGEEETIIASGNDRGYIGYYADLNGDGIITEDKDGIIYADLAVSVIDKFESTYGDFEYNKINTMKKYVELDYLGDAQFGPRKVIQATETGDDRFFVMALSDINIDAKFLSEPNEYQWCWYYETLFWDEIDVIDVYYEKDFGEGKILTENALLDWNEEVYGLKNNGDSLDIWDVFNNNKIDPNKWFVPSRAEWSAFGKNLDITPDKYQEYGLSELYWTSSIWNECRAYFINFYHQTINFAFMSENSFSLRLSTTF